MKSSKNKWLDCWRERYAYVIPTVITLVYILSSIYLSVDLTKSDHLPEALAGIVTATSILTGLLSALLGIIVQNKDSSQGIKFFFDNTDKGRFVLLLKYSVLSGFACIFLSCVLFFSDVLGTMVTQIMSFLWLWILLYYLASTYRFVNIFVSLLIKQKQPDEKEERAKGQEIDESELKKRIRENRK